MHLIVFIYLTTKKRMSMKVNWKKAVLYVVRFIELLLTGAIGGATAGNINL